MKTILSLDGGGMRGVLTLGILSVLPLPHVDLYAGTSTGSLIAASLACGLPLRTIEDFYFKQGPDIFQKRFLGGYLKPRYKSDKLKEILLSKFSDRKLSSLPFLTPAYSLKARRPRVFFNEDVSVVDACLASCAAPTFFKPHVIEDEAFVDGGVVANDPSTLAIKALDEPCRVISIGTGCMFNPINRKFWGFPSWISGGAILDVLLDGPQDLTNDLCHFLAPTFRLNPSITTPIGIDECRERELYKLYLLGKEIGRQNKDSFTDWLKK